MDFEGAFFNIYDYEITKQHLGQGSFGTVYVAKSKIDGKNYAVKVIKTEGGFNGNQQMQLMRESMILRQLHHPSIVQFIGINFQSFTDPNKLEPSIITEYLPNGSLKNILDQEKLSLAHDDWNATKKYISLLGIASAMKYLHQHKIIHRDLKPENILMDANLYPRVGDFGLSRCLPDSYSQSASNKAMTSQIGSPLYMSPELLKGETDYDPSIDVYAFAILAYEIVTGKEPYYELGKNTTTFVLANKVMSGYRPKFSNDASEKMIDLLSKCWSDNVTERPSFDEIYSLLSNDFSYFDESIDQNEVNEFIENSLNEVLKNGFYDPNEDFFQALISSHGDKRNIDEAISYLKISSERGSSFSSFLLGLFYENGEGVDASFEKAESYYLKSAEQGNSCALQRLGYCYTFGCGVEKNYSKAVNYFQKSAELGNSRALNNLGKCYQEGFGVEKSLFKAFELINKSAEFGNSGAMVNLAECFRKGLGVEKNFSKAFEFLNKACKLGNAKSYYNLALCYEKGEGVKQDFNKALELYQKSGELGHPTAYYNAGVIYKKGKGVEVDESKAREFFEKAAKLGYEKAQIYLQKSKK